MHAQSLLLASALLAVFGSAWSHAALIKSVPGNREVLEQAPTHLLLRFNEKVEAKFSRVSLEDAQGQTQALGTPAASADDPYQLETPVTSALAAGKYTVRYRVLSQDGHVVERAFAFTVKAADSAP